MHFTFGAALMTGVLLFAPAAAEAQCCDRHKAAAGMACCKDHQGHQGHQATAPETFPFAWEMDPQLEAMDPQLNPAPPVRQLAEVWFHRPVLVGKSILQGRYVIEHDTDRMARGEPCTHIYAFNDRETPVAAFHCTHLERDRADENTVVLVTTTDGSMRRLTEFQFAGETAAHGYPTVR